ncbi:cadherin domain-containing protein, partial [Anabaena sp. FACHB-1391]|uniref:cadherin domain-containing protein n=1 Tax=Anabaena sp. FACHB-1391 TaxID=2692771 RepID=UPI0016806034
GVQVVGNYAYVADRDSGLQIIDISNPTTPTLKGNYDTPGYAYGVQVVGNYAYVADGESGLQIIDISNPSTPTLKGNYDTPGSAWGVQVVGNYAYVADDYKGLQIIDISNPSTPTLKGNYNTSSYTRGVQVVGNYACVADGYSGLQIIDISNPTNPTLKGNYDTSGYAYGVQVVGSYAYVADDYKGLQIIDISNPTTPTLKGNYATSGWAYGVQVVGNYAYVADRDSGLQIIDISNPTTPTLKGNYGTSGWAYGVQVVGNYAYVADYDSGLQIIDISNPTTPTRKGNYNTSGYALGVQVVGNYAYVAGGYSGLQIIDISNPTNPTRKGNYDTSGYANGVQVLGNYAYVADADTGLQIIDISNPTTPTLKGNYDTPGYAYGVQVVGNYAYVADGYSVLQIIDISNPTTPTLKGNYDTSSFVRGVQVVGNYAYVADDYKGLQIIDISNPTTPTLKGNYDTSGYAYGVQVVGNYAYVADDDGGLKIINVSEFTGNANQAPTNLTLSTSTIAENQIIGTVVGNLSTTDPDTGNTFTYSLVTGNGATDNSLFTISGNQLRSNAVFDFETKNSYSVRLRTTDQGGLFFERQLTIGVNNVNETPTNLTLSNSTVAENQIIGTVVGNLTTTDPDTANTFTYSLVTGTGATDNSLFTISGNQLRTNAVFNFETKNSYSIRLRTTDQGGLFFERQLTIGVNNVNETPTNLTLSNNTVAENQVSGTVVGNLTTTDPDTANTFTYSLVTGDGATDNSLFTISGNQLRTNAVFNFETKNNYSIRLRTTDQGGLFFERQLTIGVSNVNETPTNVLLDSSTVAENQAIGTVIGNFGSTDPDTANTFTYSLVTGDGATDNSLFTISGNQLRTNAVFDFETKNSYSVRVRTTDQGGLTFEKQLNITVNDINEAPTDLSYDNTTDTTTIDEGQTDGIIGNLISTDPDTGSTFTYSLITGDGDTDNSSFSIVDKQLIANIVFDFETQTIYSIRVKTEDQGGLSFEKQLNITVTNVNEAVPVITSAATATFAENGTGTVYTVIATDADAGTTLTYSLSGTDANLFNINSSNGVVTFKTAPNFELPSDNGANNIYDISVIADDGTLTATKDVAITVTNINDAPTNLTLSTSTVEENKAVGTVVGNLTSTGQDIGNTFTYSLVTGDGATDNSLFTITGNQLKTNAVFDFETKNSYSIRVKTTDQSGLSFERQLTIGVSNVNDAPTNLTLSTSTIEENKAVGTVVGNLTSTGQDIGNTFTYSLVTGDGATDNSLFTITGNQLKTNAVFDFETKNSYSIRVKTTDQSGLSFERQLTIGVSNVNDAPTNLTLSTSTIEENKAVGTVVGNLTSTDQDTGNTFTYSLIAGVGDIDNSSFYFVGNQLIANTVFDFETQTSYSIRVKTEDQDGLSFERQLNINVNDINEAPTDLLLDNTAIDEGQTDGVIGNLISIDPDTGNTFTYSLVTGDGDTENSLFSIVDNQLIANTVFDFETKNSYSIRVKTTDQGGLSFERQLTIGVNNVNETPTNLTLSNNTVAENQVSGTVVGNLTTTDPDTANTFTYSLVTGDGATDNSLFTITGNQLRTNAVFNFETKNSYSVRVRTTDQSGLFFERQLTISINNVTENDNDNFTTTPQQDIIDAQGGDDTTTSILANLQQNDTIKGGNGTDTLIISGGTVNDLISIDTNNTTNQLDIPGTTVFGFERFDLTSFAGTISFNGTTGNDWIKAGTGNDDLGGGNGNDTLNGGAGADLLGGGSGNDTYVVDNVGDVIIEFLNQGIDTVESSITWTLRANLENLTLQGTTAINGTGNTLNNTITGNTGNNVLNGGAGADTLIGGLGNDSLIGGAGNDSYYVDSTADIITESVGQGLDSVFSTAATYTLSANVENLTLQGTTAINGTGNTLNNIITGNAADNVLNGGAGADTLIGGAGNDSYYVDNTADSITENLNEGTDIVFSTVTYTLTPNTENLTLQGTTAINGTGNTLNNIITGNAADNVITGGTGADTLLGGAGNDTYYVDNTADSITELGGQGTDSVFSTVTYTLTTNVENLVLQGTTSINGTG